MKNKHFEPQVSIAVKHVIAWSRRRSQKPTRAEAAQWLKKYRSALEGALRSLVAEHLDEVLYEAAAMALPDPRIDQEYRKIDHAIDESVDAYAKAMDLDAYGGDVASDELLQLADILSNQRPDSFRACIEMEHDFGPHTNDYVNSSPTHRTRRVHIIVTDGTITAQLVGGKACRHGDDVFLPDSLGDRQQLGQSAGRSDSSRTN